VILRLADCHTDVVGGQAGKRMGGAYRNASTGEAPNDPLAAADTQEEEVRARRPHAHSR
jgi:hypothetical protein